MLLDCCFDFGGRARGEVGLGCSFSFDLLVSLSHTHMAVRKSSFTCAVE